MKWILTIFYHVSFSKAFSAPLLYSNYNIKSKGLLGLGKVLNYLWVAGRGGGGGGVGIVNAALKNLNSIIQMTTHACTN